MLYVKRQKRSSLNKLTSSIPLCFIYPPMLHLRACAKTRTAIALDWALLVFGIGICAFTTVQTIRSLAEPAGPPPVFGKCTIPQGKF